MRHKQNPQTGVYVVEEYAAIPSNILQHNPASRLKYNPLLAREAHGMQSGVGSCLAGGKPKLVALGRPVHSSDASPTLRQKLLGVVVADDKCRKVSDFVH